MLRYGLSSQPDLMLHSQPGTQLEQGLAVSLNQFVKNSAASRSRDGLEDIAHEQNNRQVAACLSRRKFIKDCGSAIREVEVSPAGAHRADLILVLGESVILRTFQRGDCR